MTLTELGEMLREARLRKGLTINDVSACLKINPQLIGDLEEGIEPALPHVVYVRGFVKSYARLVGISDEDIAPGLALYAPQIEHVAMQSVSVTAPRHSHWGLKLFATACLLCAVGFWYYKTQWNTPELEVVEPAELASIMDTHEVQKEDTALSAMEVDTSGTRGLATSMPDQTATGTIVAQTPVAIRDVAAAKTPDASPSQPVAAPVPAASSSVALAQTANAAEHAPDAGPAQAPVAPVDQNTLVLTGTGDCWVHVTIDETNVRQFTIKPGETRSFNFGKTLVMKLGNAGGVQLRYNGEDLPAPGSSGQVKTLKFPLSRQ